MLALTKAELLILLIMLLFVDTTLSQRQDQTHALWRIFEDKLVNSSAILYNLSAFFFPVYSWNSGGAVTIQVDVMVDRIDDAEFVPLLPDDVAGLCCYTNMGYCGSWVNCRKIVINLEQPRVESGSTQLSDLLAGIEMNSVLSAFDPAFYYLMKMLSEERLGLISLYSVHGEAVINFHLDELAVMPSEQELNDSLSAILTWAKAYARAHGRPYVMDDSDRYAVVDPENTEDQDESMLISPASTSILMMCALLLANLLVLMVAMMFFDSVFLSLQSGDKLRALYMASGVILTMLNIITFVCEVVLLNQIISEANVLVYYTGVKLPLMVLVFTIEIITVPYNIFKHQPMKCMNCIAHSFASCHMLWFLHRLVTDVIISITSFITAPAQTLGVLTLILSTVGCAIMFVAYMIHKRLDGSSRRTCFPMISGIIIGFTTCGLVFIFTLLFIALVDNGLKSAGIGGFILSLIPPSIIFVAGLIVEWKLSMGVPQVISRSILSESISKRSQKDSLRDTTHFLSTESIQIGDDDSTKKETFVSSSPYYTMNEYTPLLH